MAKESADDKLLRMMKKTTSSVAVNASSAAGAPSKKKFKIVFSVSLLNTILFLAILACLCFLFVFEIPSGCLLLKQSVKFPSESKSEASLSDIALPSTLSADYYLRVINERNIFKPYVPKTAAKAAVQDLAMRMSKYRLVGISWLDLPETASIMIEDKQKKETLFLKQGEQLEGVTVKAIYTDRAVFSHENEETTIKL